MITAICAVIIGLILLAWSADLFVSGAATTAKNLGISPILIGLTVVSIGTSAPEIMVSLISALQGHTGISVGNAIGSNIANIGLVLGITTLIAPLPISPSIAKREAPLLVLVTLVAGGCMYNLFLGMLESVVLLTGLLITLCLMIYWQKSNPEEPPCSAEESQNMPRGKAYLKLALGLILLLVSAQILVWGATNIATLMGISELVIGLTIIAIGTSLPELAASIASTLKGHYDIALGNVVGSNIFNILAVLSVPGLVMPGTLNSSVMTRDYPVMLALTIFITALAILGKKPRSISKLTGIALLTGYSLYSVLLYLQSS